MKFLLKLFQSLSRDSVIVEALAHLFRHYLLWLEYGPEVVIPYLATLVCFVLKMEKMFGLRSLSI